MSILLKGWTFIIQETIKEAGTGKTTIARIMANLFKGIGVLKKDI